VWNICSGVVSLESPILPTGLRINISNSHSYPAGSFEVEFETFGITAEDTSTFYRIDSSKPSSVLTVDPWCRPVAPSWSQSAGKQRREVVGNISLCLSSLFDSSGDSRGSCPAGQVKQQMAENNYQQALLCLNNMEPPVRQDCLRDTHVSDRIRLLSHISEEVSADSLSLSSEWTAALIEAILLSLFLSAEMSDCRFEMILATLLAKDCCHSALLFVVEAWLQTNTFAELIADPLLSTGSLSPSLDPSSELLRFEKEKWDLSFVICWCVKFLAFDFPSPTLPSKYDLVVLAVNLAQSILRFGIVVISEWRQSLRDPIFDFQLPLEILRPIDLLLPRVAEHDSSFSPSSLEIFFSFVRVATSVSRDSDRSPSARRFVEGVCLILTKMEPSPREDLKELLPDLHPRRKADQVGYALRVSDAGGKGSVRCSLWNIFDSSSLARTDRNALQFFEILKETFPTLQTQTKRIVATLLRGLLHSLFVKLEALPSEVAAVPPVIRKRMSLQQINGGMVSTTLRGIIERGEALPHLNPVDIFVLFVGSHAEEIVALLNLAMILGQDCSPPPQKPLPEKAQKPKEGHSTTHEDRMNRAPVDGRVSVRTGKRLVGSTITRRLLGHTSGPKKKLEEVPPVAESKLELDEDSILGVLGSCRLILNSMDASLRPENSNDGRLVQTLSGICSAASANLGVAHQCDEESLEKYFASILDRECSRVSACYETLRISLLLVRVCYPPRLNEPSTLFADCQLQWLSTDCRRLAELMAVSSLLPTSDPFLSLRFASHQPTHWSDFLDRRMSSLQLWARNWLQIVLTATDFCRSCPSHLCGGSSIGEQLAALLRLLETHCHLEGIRGVTLSRDESLALGGYRLQAVDHLLATIGEGSSPVSRLKKPTSRRSSTHTQNHEFYRLMSLELHLGDASCPELRSPDCSQLLRASLFHCCFNIISTSSCSSNDPQLGSPLLADLEIIWRLSDNFVDAVDRWLALSLPPAVPPLSPLPTENISPESDDRSPSGGTAEIFNCLKLALKGLAAHLEDRPILGHPLGELVSQIHHSFGRWSAYVSTFTEPLPPDGTSLAPHRPAADPDLFRQWTFSLRVASRSSFLDRAVARASSVRSLLSFFGTASGNAFQSFDFSATALGERGAGIFASSEIVSEMLLRLVLRRAERFRDLLPSQEWGALPLSGASLFAYCQSNGIKCERHHQELREVLVSLLGSGDWELGQRISKSYVEEYRETAKGAQRKEGKSTPSHSALHGVQDRLSTLVEELDRVTEKFQDRLLHEGDSRPRPLYFAVRFLESPWKAGVRQELQEKFAQFFDVVDFSVVDHATEAFVSDQHWNSMSLAGIGHNELWLLIKVDPQAFLESSLRPSLVIDEIEQSHGPIGSEARLVHQLESAFPGYVVVSSAALYPCNRNPIDPALTANSSTPFLPFSSKVVQVFRAFPNISFDSDQPLVKSFLDHVTAGTSAPSSRRLSATSNPHLRRRSVSSPGGIVDFTRRRRRKNLSAYSSILGRPPASEAMPPDSRHSAEQPGDFLPMLFDSEVAGGGAEADLSVWEAYSYCDSFVIHTELSEELDEIEKDDCVSTVTIVLKTSSCRKSRSPENSSQLEDPLEILLDNRNSTVPYRLCLLSSVFIFPSVLSHAYCLLRHQLRVVLHCYELLQSCSASVDQGAMSVNDICHPHAILLYATSSLMGLVSGHRNCAGKKPFGLENSSELISGEGERRNILWQHKRRQLKREMMTKRPEDDSSSVAEAQPEFDIAEMETRFLAELDEAEARYLNSMGIAFGEGEDGDIDNLYETVVELNNGLKASVAATISLFKKVSSKLTRLGSKEPEKRPQRKGSQVGDSSDSEAADFFSFHIRMPKIWKKMPIPR
jgi:hypothetical protein